MKSNYLLPFQCKKIGWIMLILGLLFAIVMFALGWDPFFDTSGFDFLEIKIPALVDLEPAAASADFFTITENNVIDELIGLLLILGAIFIALSKEKREDEFISKVRLDSLVWAVYVNYVILILSILFTYGIVFLWTLAINMFTILLFFIIRFNWVKYKSRKLLRDEK